jgi:hypothetical protein
VNGNVYAGLSAFNYGIWAGSTSTIVINGSVFGGPANYGVGVYCKGTLNITGSVTGGSASSAHGICTSAATAITVGGNVLGGSNGAAGIRFDNSNSSATVSGSVTGGSTSTSYGIANASSSITGCIVNANGGVYGAAATAIYMQAGTVNAVRSSSSLVAVVGGSAASAYGISISGSTILNITGTVTGGTVDASAYGVNASGTGAITITGDVSASLIARGIHSTSSSPITITGNVTSSAGSGVYGLYVGGGGKITIIGNVSGGSNANAVGVWINFTGMLLITGNVTGGTVDVTAYAVKCNSTGWVFYSGTKTNQTANAFNSETYVRNGVIAKTAGNWNTNTNWYGDAVPTTGQNIILNGLSMTFDIDSATVGDVCGQGGAGQISFDVSGGNKSFTATNIYAGTNTGGCIKVTGDNGNTFTLSCQNLYGGSSSGAMGMDIGSAGTFNVVMSGNVYGGSTGLTTAGVRIAANVTFTLTGNVYATSTSYGINVLQSNITVNITGHIYGGESSSNYVYGFYVSSSYSNVTLNVTGNLYGGGGAGMYNVAVRYEGQSDNSAITVNGSCYGSATASNAGGAAIRADGRQQIIVTGSCYGRRYSDSIGNYAIYLPYYATSAQTLRVDGDLIVETDAHTSAVALGAGVAFTLGGDIYCSSKGIAVGGFKSFNWNKANGRIVIVSNGTPLTFASSPFRRLGRFV